MNYSMLLEHYKNDLSSDVSLIDDAIATLEQYFSYLNMDDLMHRSRPLAIAYLALIEVKEGEEKEMNNRFYGTNELKYKEIVEALRQATGEINEARYTLCEVVEALEKFTWFKQESGGKGMNEVCNDNRFELIEKFKRKLMEDTNISTCPEEMEVIDNVLFRFWQMGWLEQIERGGRVMTIDDYEKAKDLVAKIDKLQIEISGLSSILADDTSPFIVEVRKSSAPVPVG